MKFDTVDQAMEYYQENFTQSDDSDKEFAMFERWLMSQDVVELKEDNSDEIASKNKTCQN